MAHDPEKHRKARMLYIQRRSLQDIAEHCGVCHGTIKRWRMLAKDNGDDWDTARAAYQLSDNSQREFFNQVLQDYSILHSSVAKELRDPECQISATDRASSLIRLADALSKTQSMVRTLYPAADKLAITGEVLTLLMEYLREQAPDLASGLLNHLEPFGIELSRKYG